MKRILTETLSLIGILGILVALPIFIIAAWVLEGKEEPGDGRLYGRVKRDSDV